VAATIAAAVALGAESAVVLQHTTSSEVLADRYGPDMQNSVGYASIVLGR
jgi:predicted class III extradiol MEMO1 family dioxygenase